MKLKRYDIYSENNLIDQECDNGDYVIWSGRLQSLADKDECKPLIIKDNNCHCPHCDKMFMDENTIKSYCYNCGQRLANSAM